jgi:C4-type Zn-finger protein
MTQIEGLLQQGVDNMEMKKELREQSISSKADREIFSTVKRVSPV